MDNNNLYVWVYSENASEPVLCGKLELLQGRKCIFSYDASWIVRPDAFALSVDMPLMQGIMEPPAGLSIHPIFDDAGPDRWGRNIIDKVINPLRRSQLEYLELAGENRIGCMGFSRSAAAYQPDRTSIIRETDIPNLLDAIHALNLHLPLDEHMRRLLRPTSSAGGARPKSIIQYKNKEWIAKFPAEGDEYDVCAIEQASLMLAKHCGIHTAESEILAIGKQSVLLVSRFDRDSGRSHFASARTMLIAEGLDESKIGYADMADFIRKHCASPKDTCHELYRRMVFNILIENTDDHERNHGFLYQNRQWRLSPAYDVLPQHQGLGYHHLRIGKLDGNMGNIANALSESNHFLLKPAEAEIIINEIHGQVLNWREFFRKAGVMQRDIDSFDRYILRDAVYQFGRAPAKFITPSDQEYVAKIQAVDSSNVYASIGRNQVLQIDRKALHAGLPDNMLILPSAELRIRYKDTALSVTSLCSQGVAQGR